LWHQSRNSSSILDALGGGQRDAGIKGWFEVS